MKYLLPFSLIALVFIVYANSLHGEFIFDDLVILPFQDVRMHDLATIATYPRPVLLLTFALNRMFGGLNPYGYHLVNVALHAINTILVYWILSSLLIGSVKVVEKRFLAFAGASIFAVHTLLTGAVSYIAGRSSVLCATFYFAAILCIVSTRKHRLRYAGAAFFAICAWYTKQEAIMLPLFLAGVLALQHGWKLRRIVLLAGVPFVVMWIYRASLMQTWGQVIVNQPLVDAGFEAPLGPVTYFRTYVAALLGYVAPRIIWPTDLSVDPAIVAVTSWSSPWFWLSFAFLAILAWSAFRKTTLFSYAVLAFLVSPLLAYAFIPMGDVMQEHRLYIPALGIAFLSAWFFQWIMAHYADYRIPMLAAVLLLFSYLTIEHNKVWSTQLAAWKNAVELAPNKVRPHFNLAMSLQSVGRLPESVQEYQQVLRIKPDVHAAYSNMAAILIDGGNTDMAEKLLLRVLSLSPRFSQAWINLGVLYLRKREPTLAIKPFTEAIAIDPDSWAAYFSRGSCWMQLGQPAAAVPDFEKAMKLRPDISQFKEAWTFARSRAS